MLEKFAAIQMLDVHFPTTDGRALIFTRYTQPEKDHQLLPQQLKLRLPPQPPLRIAKPKPPIQPLVVGLLYIKALDRHNRSNRRSRARSLSR